MLQSLYIKNYVLIDELHIHFDDGFSVVTGETGAGKSIILGALSLVLGDRADSKSIQKGYEKCVIEAIFDISAYHLQSFFEDNDLAYEASECIFRRELYSSGKSRAFINDSPASLTIIKNLGSRLIDIHSQHRNLLLTDFHFQLNVVDLMAQTENLLFNYRSEYNNYLLISKTLDELFDNVNNTKKEEDYIRFLYDELSAAKLKLNEQEDLEQELSILSHAEEIKTTFYKVTDLLNGDNRSVVGSLKEALSSIESLSDYFPKASEFAERLRSAFIDINDLSAETNKLKDEIDYNPEQQSYINDRLNLIYSLQQKHKVHSVEELIIYCEKYSSQLQLIDSFDEEIALLKQKKEKAYQTLVRMAQEITVLRKESAKAVEKQLSGQMILLGVPNTRFQISFTQKPTPGSDGMDEVNFLFSANKNEQLKPVAQAASGGEISRLMLCVKSMIAGYSALPSIIFDEIDSGVSGEIADKMAGIMHDLGSKMQVITITHLPQIAAKGKTHYFVYKEDTHDCTLTHIRCLDNSERIDEIARLLSGSEKTQAAYNNAKALLKLI